MPTPDTTILDLIRAGELEQASAAIEAGWPDSFFEVIVAGALRQASQGKATSGSSAAIGTGTKSFTLDSPHGWPNGTPVYIMETGAPATNFMVGTLSADETSGGVITVNVTRIGGSGTFTSWTIITMLAIATVVSPPVAVADGGTGATTKGGARSVLECGRIIQVAAVEASPAAAAVYVAAYPSQKIFIPAGGEDDFAGHDFDLATTSDGGSTWTFEDTNDSDLFWSQDAKAFYVAIDNGAGGIADNALRVSPRPPDITTVGGASYSPPFDAEIVDRTIIVTGICTITLPSQAAGAGYRYRIVRTGTSTVTINVASGGTINGAASATLLTQWSSALFIQIGTGVYVEAD
jgi:hypothetical protein